MFKNMFRQGEARLIYMSPQNLEQKQAVPNPDEMKNPENTEPVVENMEGVAGKRSSRVEGANKNANVMRQKLNRTQRVTDAGPNAKATAIAKATAEANVTINQFNGGPEAAAPLTEEADRAKLNVLWQEYKGKMLEVTQNPKMNLQQQKTEQVKLNTDLNAKLVSYESHFRSELTSGDPRKLPNPIIYQIKGFDSQSTIKNPLTGLTPPQKKIITTIFNNNLDDYGSVKNMKDFVDKLNYESAKNKIPVEWVAGRDDLAPSPVFKDRTPVRPPTLPRKAPGSSDVAGGAIPE